MMRLQRPLHANVDPLTRFNLCRPIYVVYCAERFNCSINDLIYVRLPIIINSYVLCNLVDKTTLDRVAFLRKLIMLRDSSLTVSGLLSSDELNDVIWHVCTN